MVNHELIANPLSENERKELILLRKLKWCCNNTYAMYDYLTDDSIREFFLENEYKKDVSDLDKDTDVFWRGDWIFRIPKRGAVRQSFLGDIMRSMVQLSPAGKNSAKACHVVRQMLPERGPWCDDWDERETNEQEDNK